MINYLQKDTENKLDGSSHRRRGIQKDEKEEDSFEFEHH